MDERIFRAPPPYTGMNMPRQKAPIYMTSEGMMMPSHMQPPPMYGPRGATIPPKFLRKKHTNGEFYCETCDRDFQFQIDLDTHIGEHQRCGIDGCPFYGNPQLVAKHIEQQHTSGLYDKLKNLNTPEEIAKWREERRKRYPTQANVALRQQIQAERFKRGERLAEGKSRFGRQNDRNRCRENEKPPPQQTETKSRKRKRVRKSKREEKPKVEVEEKKTTPEDADEEYPIEPFKGTAEIDDYPRPVKKKKAKVINALSSLVGLYGSDSEENDSEQESDQEATLGTEKSNGNESGDNFSISSDEDDHTGNPFQLLDILSTSTEQFETSSPLKEKATSDPSQTERQNSVPKPLPSPAPKEEPIPEEQPDTDPQKPDSDSDDQQEEVPFKKVVESFDEDVNTNKKCNEQKDAPNQTLPPKKPAGESSSSSSTVKKAKPKKKTISGLDYSRLKRRRQNTMLEKLLHKDIVHERNVLLQCVRYVVQKNFFGIGQPK